MDVPRQVHVAPLGLEFDRIVEPIREYGADRAVLLDYLPAHAADQAPVEDVLTALDGAGIDHRRHDYEFDDLFDPMAAFGAVIENHRGDDVYVNLATGNKVTAVAGMLACMATGGADPYYVEAEQHGSHRGPVPSGVRSVDAVPPYPMESPDRQHLAVMDHVARSDRTTRDGEPYRIKRELFEFGEDIGLPFMADYDGDTEKGKFRRLDTHVLSPLRERGFVTVEEVGTRKRVLLTDAGRNTLRAFRYRLETADDPD